MKRMKKLFVSVPMAGRNQDDIVKSMDKMHQIMETVTGEKLEMLPTWINDSVPMHINNSGLWYLGKSLEMMAEADYFIGFGYYMSLIKNHKGCELETEAAGAYDLPQYLISDETMAEQILPDLVKPEDEEDGGLL